MIPDYIIDLPEDVILKDKEYMKQYEEQLQQLLNNFKNEISKQILEGKNPLCILISVAESNDLNIAAKELRFICSCSSIIAYMNK